MTLSAWRGKLDGSTLKTTTTDMSHFGELCDSLMKQVARMRMKLLLMRLVNVMQEQHPKALLLLFAQGENND